MKSSSLALWQDLREVFRRLCGIFLTIPSPIRVLIADDHPLFRAGVAAVVGCQPDMEVVGEAANGIEAVSQSLTALPDVVLMDLQMPDMDGLTALTVIHREQPGIRIIVITTYGGDVQTARALRLGASGYLLKDTLRRDLVDAIRSAVGAPGRRAESSDSSSTVQLHPEPLSAGELEVLREIAKARSNDEIAIALGVSASLVKARVRSILLKLGAQDRTHAVIIAIKRGVIVV